MTVCGRCYETLDLASRYQRYALSPDEMMAIAEL